MGGITLTALVTGLFTWLKAGVQPEASGNQPIWIRSQVLSSSLRPRAIRDTIAISSSARPLSIAS